MEKPLVLSLVLSALLDSLRTDCATLRQYVFCGYGVEHCCTQLKVIATYYSR